MSKRIKNLKYHTFDKTMISLSLSLSLKNTIIVYFSIEKGKNVYLQTNLEENSSIPLNDNWYTHLCVLLLRWHI